MMKIAPDNPCANAKKYSIGQKCPYKIDAVNSMIAKTKRKKTFKDNEQKTSGHLQNPNTKIIIDFDCESAASINSLAINKNSNVKVTPTFFQANC